MDAWLSRVIKTSKFKLATSVAILMVVLTGAFALVNATTLKAQAANGASLSSTVVDVSVVNTGDEGGSATLERNLYVEGDSLVLNWKGAAIGTDFVIPTKVKYGNDDGVTWNTQTLISLDQVQVDNDRYRVRMGSDGNMTSYSSLKDYVVSEHSISLGTVAALSGNVEVTWQRVAPVYRMYNIITSEHLFTTNKTEYDSWVAKDVALTDYWVGEGISWLAPKSGTAVHRFYNAALGAMGSSSHYYTADTAEMQTLLKNGWVDDGVDQQFFSGGNTAIWTCYNEGLGSAHHYTTSKTEWEGLEVHGWDLERAKNGTNGVFQGVTGTSWTYSDSYYQVQHVLDGDTQGATTQWVAGKAGQKTNAKALSFPGYKQASISAATIAADNSTVVKVNYDKATYNLTVKNSDGQGNDRVTGVKYQSTANLATPNDLAELKFGGFYYDSAFTKPYNTSATMPAGNITVYTKWTDTVEGTTNYVIKHVRKAVTGSGDADVVEAESVSGVAVGSTTDAGSKVREYTGFVATTPTEVTVEANGVTEVEIIYERVKYTVKFVAEASKVHGDLANQTVEYEGTATKPNLTIVDTSAYDTITFTDASDGKVWDFANHKVTGDTTINVVLSKNENPTPEPGGETTRYTVNHIKKAISGTDTADETEVQVVSDAKVGDKTNLSEHLRTYEGFKTGTFTDTVIKANGETVVDITYARETYTITINTEDSYTVEPSSITAEYGSVVSAPKVTVLDETKEFKCFYKLQPLPAENNYTWENLVLTSNMTFQVMLTEKGSVDPTPDLGSTYTIKYEGNGATSGSMGADTRFIGDNRKLSDNKFLKKDTTYSYDYYGFRWWVTEDGTRYDGNYQGDIKGVKAGDVVTLKAVWTDEAVTGDYWIAPASKITTGNTADTANQPNPEYTHPYNNVIKTHNDIQTDITKVEKYIRGDRSAENTAVYNEYKGFMENDNYHLYTTYTYSDINKLNASNPYSEDDFAEFRIIQLGAHMATGDGKGTTNGQYSDGTTFTFQMTHSLPDPYPLFEEYSAKNARFAWDSSSAKTSYLLQSGKIGSLFKGIYKSENNAKVNKWYAKEVKDWATMQESKNNVLWMLSVSELATLNGYVNYSNQDQTNAAYEGEQYYFWKRLGIYSNWASPALSALGKTRSGNEINYTYWPAKYEDGFFSGWGTASTSKSYVWTRTFARNANPDTPWSNNIIGDNGGVNTSFVTCAYAGYNLAFGFTCNSLPSL